MSTTLDARLFAELHTRVSAGLASGELFTQAQIDQQIDAFQANFGTSVLRGLDGEALLLRMHGRADPQARCMAYWLEFKNDDEFDTFRFGSVAGGFVSIGWKERLSDLSEFLGISRREAKEAIRDRLSPQYLEKPAVATRKAGEILNFASQIAENDLVLACDGQRVLGVGRVTGPYAYDGQLHFPHKRPVEWLSLDQWQMPEAEGLRTTVHYLGNKAANLLELEKRIFNREGTAPAITPSTREATASLPRLEPTIARVEGILRRKGQAILYGPPGTGKTFYAIGAAKELAARQAFRKTYKDLSDRERGQVDGETGLVRVCTFHPGYGYEDFVEGLRPTVKNGQMVFEPRDGHFKKLCEDAQHQSDRHFFLIIDEINRGDVPRISPRSHHH